MGVPATQSRHALYRPIPPVWKNLTAVERFSGEDLGVLLYGNSRYRYFHDNAPVLEIPLVERTDFYDCRETFDGGVEGDQLMAEVVEDDDPFYTPPGDHVGLAVRLGESPDSNRFYVVDQLDRLAHVFQHALR